MGNFLRSINRAENTNNTNNTSNADNTNNTDNTLRFDKMTKQEIVDFLKKLDPKGLQVDDDFREKLKGLNLSCLTLFGINLEFYEKASKIVPIYKPEYGTTLKKPCFVAPTFGPDKVKNDDGIKVDMSQFTEKLELKKVPKPNVEYKTGNVTMTEYIESFKTPTCNKDLFGISKKVLFAMPNFHKQRLINIYNKFYNNELDVGDSSIGRACYMYKEAKKGPTDDMSSFRQIIGIPNSLAHFHRILSLRLSSFLNSNNYLNTTIQKGSISVKNGIFEQIFKVKEVIKDANKNNKECAIMFMDISNAFGNLNLEKLFEIMKEYHIEDGLITYLKNFYNGFEFYVKTKKWTTDLIKWDDGLIQGCPLSPTLFVLAMDYILDYLDNKYKEECGYNLGNTDNNKIMFSAFVDDICMVCNDMTSLKNMFNRIEYLLNSIGLPLNKNKCSYMSINPSDPNNVFDNIPNKKVYKYLGEYLSFDGTSSESYSRFTAMLARKLMSLDRKKVDDSVKLGLFSKCMLPWIQRKLLIMYDISFNKKTNIVSLIKKYLIKWGSEEQIHIFTFIADMILESNDQVIKKYDFNNKDEDMNDLDVNDMSEMNIYDADVINSTFRASNLNITYDSINKVPKFGNDNDKNNDNNNGIDKGNNDNDNDNKTEELIIL